VLVEGEAVGDGADALGELVAARVELGRERGRDDRADLAEVVVAEPARGQRRGPDAQARWRPPAAAGRTARRCG
jgi:hypothetical protein